MPTSILIRLSFAALIVIASIYLAFNGPLVSAIASILDAIILAFIVLSFPETKDIAQDNWKITYPISALAILFSYFAIVSDEPMFNLKRQKHYGDAVFALIMKSESAIPPLTPAQAKLAQDGMWSCATAQAHDAISVSKKFMMTQAPAGSGPVLSALGADEPSPSGRCLEIYTQLQKERPDIFMPLKD